MRVFFSPAVFKKKIMSNIFTLDKIDFLSDEINIDELYEKKQQQDLNQLTLFKKILARAHMQIKLASRQKESPQICWFLVPEMIWGVPKYDHAACIAYVMNKLQMNGFQIRYIHPNLLLISWVHWVPQYVRDEIKTKLGIEVNEFGEKIQEEEAEEEERVPEKSPRGGGGGKKREYTPIHSYRPSGNLIYSDKTMNQLKKKFS